MSDRFPAPAGRPLGSLVVIDPESLPLGTDPHFAFHYLDISAAANGRLSLPSETIEYRVAPSRARRVIRNGDVLMATVRPNLKAFAYCNLPPGNFVASTGFAVLRPINETDSHFVLSSILSDDVTRQIERYVVGSNYPAINSSDVRRLQIPGFDPIAQRRIGEIIATVDEAIEQTEALIAKTQRIKTGLMHDLFTRGVTPDGQLRPPHKEAPKLYKDSPLGWIPKEWEHGRLSDKRSPGRPHLKTGPFGSSLKLEHWVEEGRPVITIGALGEGEFINDELLHVSEETAERLRDYQLQVGDVVFSRVADVGRSAAIGEEQKRWIMSSNLMRISLDRDLVAPPFLQAQLGFDFRLRRQIRATVNAGGRDVANSAILNRLNFAWPPKEEQERIVERFVSLEGLQRSNAVSLGELRLTKAGLMHDLLTGRVRVPVADAPKVAVLSGATP